MRSKLARRLGITGATLSALFLAVVAPSFATNAAVAPKCLGQRATIVGTAGPDTIRGTRRDDVILARGGADTVYGLRGFDRVCGGGGNDRIFGGDGGDSIEGGGGSDRIVGAQGNDIIGGGVGHDIIKGGTNIDQITAGDGNDLIEGGPGNTDIIRGGPGEDVASYASATATVVVDLDRGEASGGHGFDDLISIEDVLGGHGADELRGNAAPNVIDGGPGPDLITGLAGGDLLLGGGGDDELTGVGSDPSLLDGGAGNDTLTVSGGEHLLFGSGGDDHLAPQGAFSTYLEGGAGNDQLDGAGGDDLLLGGADDDQLTNTGGLDLFVGGSGSDAMTGGPSGLDAASFADAPVGVTIDFVLGTAIGHGSDTLSNIVVVEGSPSGDTVTGGTLAEAVFSRAGVDSLTMGGGDDFVDGGEGDDSITGGSGIDTSSYAASTAPVTVDLLAGTATGMGSDTLSGIEAVEGSPFDDVLSGSGVGEYFIPMAGDDTVNGSNGFDMVLFPYAEQGVTAHLGVGSASGEGADSITSVEDVDGSPFNDTITGSPADNFLFGEFGNDSLSGGLGTDFADGGPGTDTCSAEVMQSCENPTLSPTQSATEFRSPRRVVRTLHRFDLPSALLQDALFPGSVG
jgi:Ca2+-binding RTX toxin-like protein